MDNDDRNPPPPPGFEVVHENLRDSYAQARANIEQAIQTATSPLTGLGESPAPPSPPTADEATADPLASARAAAADAIAQSERQVRDAMAQAHASVAAAISAVHPPKPEPTEE